MSSHIAAVRAQLSALTAVIALTVGMASPAGAARPPSGPVFEMQGHHPGAAAQPTATGRALVDLQTHDGKVYAGYGDYYKNTGPIALAGFDATSGFVVEHMVDSEAVYNLREIDGELVAPSTDPKVSADITQSGPWSETSALKAAHVYDTVTMDGTDRWAVGSQGYHAVAWRTADGGVTWTEMMRVAARSTTAGDFSRFYFAGVLGGQLHLQAYDNYGGAHPSSLTFDGSAWTTGPDLVGRGGRGWRPVEFQGRMFISAYGHGSSGSIRVYDGSRVKTVASAFDLEVADGRLVMLDDRGQIRTSANGTRWTTVGAAPAGARSVTVMGGSYYVGTSDGALWSAPTA